MTGVASDRDSGSGASARPAQRFPQTPSRLCALLLASALGLALLAPDLSSGPAFAQSLPASPPATLMADELRIDPQGRLIASGAVEVWQGSTRLTASRITYDEREGGLTIEGPLTITDGPDMVTLADQGALSSDMRTGLLASARVVLHQQLQIAARSIERREGRVSHMEQVIASSCEVCAADPTPLWEIRAQSITHDEEARTIAFRRAQLRFAGVPVLALPNMTIPEPSVGRARGILAPTVRISSELGISFAQPYFIPFGADRDLTLTPQISSEGSRSLGLRWRQGFSNGGIDLGGQVTTDHLNARDWRGYGYLRALLALPSDFTLTADLTLLSDSEYLETYDISDESRLTNHITLERIRRDQAIRARVVAFESLRAGEDNNILPRYMLQAEWQQRLAGLPIGGRLDLSAGFRAWQRPSHLDGDPGRDIARAHFGFDWQRQNILPGGVLATTALRGRLEQIRIEDDSLWPDPVGRSSAEAMLELRWPLARVGADGGRQLFEPVLQLIAAQSSGRLPPNDDNRMPELDGGNLFAPIRYLGEDAPDEGSRINAGLRWMRHAPGGWNAETLIGRIWRADPLPGFDPLHDQPLGQSRSDWLLAARLDNASGLALSTRLLFNDSLDLSRAEGSLSWATAAGSSFVTRVLYVPANPFEDRADALTAWTADVGRSFENGWSGRVGWDYDFGTQEWGEARSGLVFRTECIAVDLSLSRRFATSTNLTATTRFGLRVELLGLTGRNPGAPSRVCRA